MDYCTSAINNHQEICKNTIYTIEEERDNYKSDFHLFLTNVIERITSTTDILRKLTFESRDEVLEACKTCDGILNVWDYHRVQTHSSDEIHLDNVSEISQEALSEDGPDSSQTSNNSKMSDDTPSQTSESEYITHLENVHKPLLEHREIASPSGEWVIPETDTE